MSSKKNLASDNNSSAPSLVTGHSSPLRSNKPLPLGNHTFKKVINEGCLYVDKTEEIYKLLESGNTKYFFLSRPRRFGKSLLVTTLEEIFLGNQELFKGLWIFDKIEWKKYPVIRLAMNDLVYSEGLEGFKTSLFNRIREIFNKYDLKIESSNYKEGLKELILRLSKTEKVVLLIDEYDKPIIEYIEDIEKAKEMRFILKNFYETIKANDEYIHFAFMTGVSKFSKVSVFSALNNLNDITLDEKYSKIVGIDEEQLYNYFPDRIGQLAEKLNITEDTLKKDIRTWYNGYSWDGKNFLYNPYSLLLFFEKEKIDNYWFESGTPTFLFKIIREKQRDVTRFENKIVGSKVFESFEPENIDVESLLFQTGYLTIKDIKEPNSPFRRYVLNYPNMEVKESFLNHLLMNFSENSDNDSILIFDLVESLNNNDLERFFEIIKNVFYNIPSVIFMSDKEAYYQTIIYLILTLIGIRINTEVWTNKGRIDAVTETTNCIYVFEFKMTSVTQAVKQIESKKYYEKYLSSGKEILLVGVSFGTQERNIKEYKVQSI